MKRYLPHFVLMIVPTLALASSDMVSVLRQRTAPGKRKIEVDIPYTRCCSYCSGERILCSRSRRTFDKRWNQVK